MERQPDTLLDSHYYNSDGSRKKNGIYCQQIDRWILIDDYDMWITFKTAQALSSKLATTVYVLSEDIAGMTNLNCLNYSMMNKTIFKRKNVADLIQNQTPTMKKLVEGNIVEVGIPEDYKSGDGIRQLKKMKNFVNFVNKTIYGIEICNSKNWIDNKTVSTTFHPTEWSEVISAYEHRSESDKSVFSEVNRILYFADSVNDIKEQMQVLFQKYLDENLVSTNLVNIFYRILKEKNPFIEYIPKKSDFYKSS
jgi:predicted RNA-binding protein with TRAM domain